MTRLATLAWLGLVGAACAADLAKVDRSIANEPAYRTKAQKYALVVIGPEAKERCWLVLDGGELHVLADKPTKLTAKKEGGRDEDAFEFELGELALAGKTHHDLRVHVEPLRRWKFEDYGRRPDMQAALAQDPEAVTLRLSLNAAVPHLKKEGRVTFLVTPFDLAGPLVLAAKPADAPVIHLGGPLTVTFDSALPKLKRDRSSDVTVVVGTPGHGPGTFAMVGYDGVVPASARPKLAVAYPPAKPGEEPVKQLYELKERC